MKHFYLIACLVVFSLSFVSCSKDSEDVSQYDLRTFLIGEWKSDSDSRPTITFNSDGTGMNNIYDDAKFNWMIVDGWLTVIHTSYPYLDSSHEVTIINKNKMKWGAATWTRIGEYNPDNTGGSGSKPSESDELAPESLIGKVIRFDEYLVSGGFIDSNNRIQFYTEHDMRANWATQSSTYTYTKIGKDTGRLAFVCGQKINYVTRVFIYDITLTFKNSKGDFEYKGTKEVSGGLSGNGTFGIRGTGSYWPQLWDN